MNRLFFRAKYAYQAVIETVCRRFNNAVLSGSCVKGNMAFGPVPSRRLGYSLGINTMPHKTCTYNCVYCQVGRTTRCSIKRENYSNPRQVYDLVEKKMQSLAKEALSIDYISIVPNGEPTLDGHLSETISLLRKLNHKIAVITNSSLLWDADVRDGLSSADFVSVKIDTVNEGTWRRINRPHKRLKLHNILEGIVDFSKGYNGILATETMLVRNMNDNVEELEAIGDFLNRVNRKRSYVAVPVRPPAEHDIAAPDACTLSALSSFIKRSIPHSEMLGVSEERDFKGAGSIEEELLGIVSVHPMTEEAAEKFVRSNGGSLGTLKDMIDSDLITRIDYGGKIFYRKSVLPQEEKCKKS
jgi:wyosine [tRNA(Phe)-imidazoG37] synthetase (radical SAM superfamily)